VSAYDRFAGRIPHDFRRTAVRNLERAGVPLSAAMAWSAIAQNRYRRYATADEARLREGAVKLAAFHALEKNRRSQGRADQQEEAQRRPAGRIEADWR
jgi:hypothetical protein